MKSRLIGSDQTEKDTLMIAAKLMTGTTRTAAKSDGRDGILTIVVPGKEKTGSRVRTAKAGL